MYQRMFICVTIILEFRLELKSNLMSKLGKDFRNDDEANAKKVKDDCEQMLNRQ